MIDAIICEDCKAIFYDWWDVDHHICPKASEDRMDVTESEKIMAMVRAGAEPLLSLDEVKAKYPTSSPKADQQEVE